MRFPWQKKDYISDAVKEFFSGASSKTGIPVNHKTALQATVALACARVIAEGIAQVPLKLFRELKGGGSDPAKDHPLYSVMHTAPNQWQTSYEWRETLALHLVFAGNAYSLIYRPIPRITELLPYEPEMVEPKMDDERKIVYEVTLEGKAKQRVSQENMLHLKGPSWNTYEGLDGVRLAREAIGLALATEEHGSRFFKNGATLGTILSTDSNLKKDQVDLMRDSWNESHQGVLRAFKTAIVWGGLKPYTLGTDNEKSQFIEARKFQVEEVCRAFRVLPVMVGYSDKTATYASAEQMFLAHVVHTLGPWYARIEQALDMQLLTDAERKEGYYFKFMPNGLLRGSHEARAKYYKDMSEVGALNPNEIRAFEEMNPYEGGDQYAKPLNMGTVGDNNAPNP